VQPVFNRSGELCGQPWFVLYVLLVPEHEIDSGHAVSAAWVPLIAATGTFTRTIPGKDKSMMRSAIPLLACVSLAACSPQAKQHKQYIEFSSFTVEQGVYKPKPGWKFTRGEKDTIVVARQSGGGIVITPCECALETGGSCSQATREGPTGDILEVWCVDDKCGFCVGATSDPDNPANNVRFSVPSRPLRASQR